MREVVLSIPSERESEYLRLAAIHPWMGVAANRALHSHRRCKEILAYWRKEHADHGWHAREVRDYRRWVRRGRIRLCFLVARRLIRLLFWRG